MTALLPLPLLPPPLAAPRRDAACGPHYEMLWHDRRRGASA